MNTYGLITRRRTIRKFKQTPVPVDILKKLVNGARLAPSAGNMQPCEYVIIDDPLLLEKTFSTLKWAGYIAPQGTPAEGFRPVAYLVVLVKKDLAKFDTGRDVGAAIENILLSALEEGIGSCWIISVDKTQLSAVINSPDTVEIDSVVALGYPAEDPALESLKNSPKYWIDSEGRLHVPKRNIDSICHINGYGKK